LPRGCACATKVVAMSAAAAVIKVRLGIIGSPWISGPAQCLQLLQFSLNLV